VVGGSSFIVLRLPCHGPLRNLGADQRTLYALPACAWPVREVISLNDDDQDADEGPEEYVVHDKFGY
jgi:hypothetical protein